jgi:hypothetical protein
LGAAFRVNQSPNRKARFISQIAILVRSTGCTGFTNGQRFVARGANRKLATSAIVTIGSTTSIRGMSVMSITNLTATINSNARSAAILKRCTAMVARMAAFVPIASDNSRQAFANYRLEKFPRLRDS